MTTTTDGAARTLNDWILAESRSLALFRELGLDSCCGGDRSLAEVCRLHGLDLGEVLERLEQLSARTPARPPGTGRRIADSRR